MYLPELFHEIEVGVSKQNLKQGFQAVSSPGSRWADWLQPLRNNIQSPEVLNKHKLYSQIVKAVHEQLLKEIQKSGEELSKAKQDLNQIYDQKNLKILEQSQVVGCTTTGFATHQTLLTAFAPNIMIVEEAGEVLESHVLVCLRPHLQHLILIGDHLQLRPHIQNYSLTKDCPSFEYNLDVSLFER